MTRKGSSLQLSFLLVNIDVRRQRSRLLTGRVG
jgi:hypothetical protein